jgi:hypothetical protein
MSAINVDPSIEIVADELCPRDPTIPVNITWRPKGELPVSADGMYYYVCYDSVVLGPDGFPQLKRRFIPEELIGKVNFIPGQKSPYPPPCLPLAENQEFCIVGPGMFGVREKSTKKYPDDQEILHQLYDKVILGK